MAQSKEEKAAYQKAYYEANKEKRKAYNEANKEKALAYQKAYYEANKEKALAYQKDYNQANKEKVAERHRRYREDNKEKVANTQRAYYVANRDKCLAVTKKWAENNKERLQEYTKVYNASGKRKEYQQNNKHIFQNNSSRYRALKRKQIPVHLRNCPQEKQRLLQTYKLSILLTKTTGVQHHVDHMWPLVDGGPHWSGNLQVIPAYDNISKHASVCEETKATIIKSLYTFDTTAPI